MNKIQAMIILIGIVLLGGFLRFYNIGQESFWLDESATALTIKNYNAKEIFYNTVEKGQILPGYYESNTDLPVYYLILKIWSEIYGISESSLRAFSAIFGILSVITVYFLANMIFNQRTGLVASFIFAINAVMIEYSQEARLYSFLIFIVIISSYFLVKSLKEKRNIDIAYLVLFNAIGIYTSYSFLFFIMSEFAFAAFMEFKVWKWKISIQNLKILAALSVISALYLLLLPRILNIKLVSTHSIGGSILSQLPKLFLKFSTWIYPSVDLMHKINAMKFGEFGLYGWMLILSAMIFSLIILFSVLRNFSNFSQIDERLTFLLFWLGIPTLLAFITLNRSIAIFGSIRHFIFVVPAYLVLASNSISKLKNKKILAFFVVLLAVLSLPILHSYYSNSTNPDFREAVRFLEENSGNEVIIVSLPSVTVPIAYYSDNVDNVYGVSGEKEAAMAAKNSNSLWLVLSTKYADPDNEIKSFFGDHYSLEFEKNFHEVKLYYYKKQ